MPGRTRQRPTHLKAETPAALARQAAKEAEQARTFAGVAPGAALPPLGKRQRTLARARLSLPYARALRVVAWKLGRRSGRVPLDDHTLAIVEAVAAKFRKKEEYGSFDAARSGVRADRHRPRGGGGSNSGVPAVNQIVKRAVRAVAQEPGVIVHRRTWHLPSGRKSVA